MEFEKKVIVDVDGFIEKGKQYDLDLRLPEDNRNVIYGVIKDAKGNPVEDAVVKLVEIYKNERKPVSHTFTDCDGEFVFGPLCSHKSYSIEIWVNKVEHVKICKICEHKENCLKGIDLDCEKDYFDKHEKTYLTECEDDYKDYKDDKKEIKFDN